MATPNAANLYVGAGECFFDRFDAAGLSTGFRHLGNVDELTSNSSVDNVEKKSSMSGLRTLLAQVPKGFKQELSLTLSEWEPDNLALTLLGTQSALTQTSAPTITGGAINGGVALKLDTWYDLGYWNPTVSAVKQGVTTLVLNTDYELRLETGMVRLLSTGAATSAVTTFDGSAPAILATAKRAIIQALSVSKIKGRLRYISAADQASGPRMQVDVWNVNLFPDGDTSYIGEDFGTFKMKGEALLDLTKPVGQQFMRIVTL
jgi:hypothetical protein